MSGDWTFGQTPIVTGADYFRASAGQDDADNLATVLAGGARTIQLKDGDTFTWDTPLDPPSNTTVRAGPGVTIVSGIANSPPSPTKCTFHVDAPASINNGTLTAGAVLGSNVAHLDCTLAPVAGQVIEISHGVSAMVARIANPTGSLGGTWTGTVELVDEGGEPYPFFLLFVSGDPFGVYASRKVGVTIDGNGCLITASETADQVLEAARTDRIAFRNARMVLPAGMAGPGCDLGCTRFLLEDLDIDLQGSNIAPGWYTQSGDLGTVRRVRVSGGQVGGDVLDGHGIAVEDCWFYAQSGIGLNVSSLPLDNSHPSLGTIGGRVTGGGAVGCATGLNVSAAQGLSVTGWESVGCTTYGILVANVAHAPATTGTTFDRGQTRGCAVDILVDAGTVDTTIRDHKSSGSITSALSAVGNVRVRGFASTCSPSAAAIVLTGALADMAELALAVTSNIGVQCSGTLAIIDDSVIGASSSLAAYVVTGTLRISRTTLTGSRGLYVTAGARCEIGPGCTFDGATTPIDFTGTGTITMVQTGGIAAVSATHSLTFAEHYATEIELDAGASGDATVTTYPIPGMQWVARNLSAHNLVVQTTVTGTVTVAAGKSATVEVNAAGVMKRVTADT